VEVVSDRFYCPDPWRDGRAVLDGDEARHLAKVRRVGIGEVVTLFDGQGRSAMAEVVELGRDRVDLIIREESTADRSLAGPLILATAVPKGDRFDWLVEKATELGVTRLVPLVTARSVVDPRSAKLDRLRRLVVEASKQSGRARLMELDAPTAWADWLTRSRAAAGSRYVADPGGGRLAVGPPCDLTRGVAVTIGPEGGFTANELEEAKASGHRAIGLGPTILRVETAAIAACAAVLTWAESERGKSG
jgi:16S rRNA (uracil1498-N3)-methyltransferase